MPSTVLITGASRGIGAAAARLFAQKGWQVAANYCQSEKEARALAASHPGILAVQADVADRGQVDRMTKEVLHQFGHIDVLINNAGIAQQKLFTDVTETEWERLFSVNVTGVFHCCQAVLPGMIRRQRGKILNLSSIWGMTGASCEVAYSAAKAAVIRAFEGAGQGGGAQRHHRQLCGPRRHRHTDERRFGRRNPRGSAGGNALRGAGQARGRGESPFLPGERTGGFHHRPGHQSQRRLCHCVTDRSTPFWMICRD